LAVVVVVVVVEAVDPLELQVEVLVDQHLFVNDSINQILHSIMNNCLNL
jgi:hypothetical protein